MSDDVIWSVHGERLCKVRQGILYVRETENKSISASSLKGVYVRESNI